mgnify:FL=1
MKTSKTTRIISIMVSLAFFLCLVGCSGNSAPKYPSVLDAINSARSQLGNRSVYEDSDADVYASRLAAMYADSGSSNRFNDIAKSYMESTSVHGKSWIAYHCVTSYGTVPSSYLTSYIATRNDITCVGISVNTIGSITYTIVVGYGY